VDAAAACQLVPAVGGGVAAATGGVECPAVAPTGANGEATGGGGGAGGGGGGGGGAAWGRGRGSTPLCTRFRALRKVPQIE